MTNKKSEKALLIIALLGLIPIALGYGLMPEKTLTPLYGFSVENVNLTHILRAVMGLYFGQVIIWGLGVIKDEFRRPALYCLVVFMLGLATGRFLSFIVDGIPHLLLVVYFILELIFGFIGLKLVTRRINQ